MKTIYLSGPITGRTRYEVRKHFYDVGYMLRRQAARLSDEAVEIYDPSRVTDIDFDWSTFMKIACAVIHDPKMSAICMLKGWERSAGCVIERRWADALGLPVIYEPGAVRE